MSQHIKDIDKDFDGFSRFLCTYIVCRVTIHNRSVYGRLVKGVTRFRERELYTLENVACSLRNLLIAFALLSWMEVREESHTVYC